jgi:hypothetical protein
MKYAIYEFLELPFKISLPSQAQYGVTTNNNIGTSQPSKIVCGMKQLVGKNPTSTT